MKSIEKRLMKMAALFAVCLGMIAFIAGCGLFGSSTDSGTSEAIATAINTISSTVATAVSNGTAAQVVEQLESSGAIDASTADAIEAVLPIAGTVASTVATATASESATVDSASKHALACYPSVDVEKLTAVLWQHQSGIKPDKLPGAIKAIKGIKAIKR